MSFAPLCIEPGCPFPARPMNGSDGHGNVLPVIARCMACHGEPECVIEGCTNVAQRGDLCRVCASSRAPGQLRAPSGGDWWSQRDVIVWIMRQPAMRGVKFGVELRNGERRLVGRDGTFEIVFQSQLWKPLPTRPGNDL